MTGTDADREAALREYLLGGLATAQREEIDERLLAEPDFHAELQATGDDLIHAFLSDELPAAERERFESFFLASQRRRERVAFVRSLLSVAERAKNGQAGRSAGVAAESSPRRSPLMPMLPWAAALVVGLAAGGWSLSERRMREKEAAEGQQREASLREQVAAQQQRVRELEGLVGQDTSDVASWRLRSGLQRGAATQMQGHDLGHAVGGPPDGAGDVFVVREAWTRLRVPLDHGAREPSYRASLQTADGREILQVGGLREGSGPGGRTLDVMVPAGLLRPGAYVLSIQRDAPGSSEELTATSFVVR